MHNSFSHYINDIFQSSLEATTDIQPKNILLRNNKIISMTKTIETKFITFSKFTRKFLNTFSDISSCNFNLPFLMFKNIAIANSNFHFLKFIKIFDKFNVKYCSFNFNLNHKERNQIKISIL